MPADLWADRPHYVYEVTYGWPGLPQTREVVDVGKRPAPGDQIRIRDLWWRVESVQPPGRFDRHLGYITAIAEP